MLEGFLSRLIQKGCGTLIVVWPNGKQRSFGSGAPSATLKLNRYWTALRLALHPELALGEDYMDGSVTVAGGDIADVLAIFMRSLTKAERHPFFTRLNAICRWYKRRVAQFNPSRRARKNVAHHYDLSGKLYDLFLDADRQYSCAYFPSGNESLESAQAAKKWHLASKLYLSHPGLKILDIGCGWGGLALDLARDARASVLGITLSKEQLQLARSRAQAAGLSTKCRFELLDYRAVRETFDRIVSVGMFEHVGVGYYDAFFANVRRILADNGVMVLHTIGRSQGPGATNPWIAKYIFPGGYTPALSEIVPAIEGAGLIVTDIEVLRLHYAETLKAWRVRFRQNWRQAAALYDERFCRMWDFYLAGAEMGFRHEDLVVFQIQIAQKRDSLPLTRDYMLETERAMRIGVPARGLRAIEAAE